MSETKVELETGTDGTSQLRVLLGEEEGEDVLIEIPSKDELAWSTILFIVQVGLYTCRRSRSVPKTLYQLLKRLDMNFLEDVAGQYYKVEPSRHEYSLESWVKFLFLCALFSRKQDDMLDFLRNPAHRSWLRLVGWKKVPAPPRVSEFKTRFGKDTLSWALCRLRDQVYTVAQVDSLNDEQILNYARRRVLRGPSSYIGMTGFHLFCHFIDGLGIIAELTACLKERKANVTYTERDIVLALLHRLVLEAKNISQLAGKLRNGKHVGHLDLAPSQVTLGHAFQEFDGEKLKALNERLMKRACRNRRGQRLRVGIESSVIEVRGRQAGAVGTIEPHSGKYVVAYKLFAACDLDSKDVLYVHLVPGNCADSKQLLHTAKEVKTLAAPRRVELIMFDKGFYKQASFNELNQGEPDEKIAFITPGKKYKSLTDAVDEIEETAYRPYEEELTPHQMQKREREKATTRQKRVAKEQAEQKAKGGPPLIAHAIISLDDYEGELRLIVVKDTRLKRVKLKNEKGTRYLRDKEGNILTGDVWETLHYTYLTNIPENRLKPEGVITAYKGRWRIEDLFEELKNDWGLKYFPSTDNNSVQSHVYFIFILYTAVSLFKQLLFKDTYARKMLNSLQIDVFQAIYAVFERWLLPLSDLCPGRDGVISNLKLLYRFGQFRLHIHQKHSSP
ncbi:MAG: transposase [bacterium]|nr:transposase [bacterium]